MYRKNVEDVRIRRVRFNDYEKSIHTNYIAIDTKFFIKVGWSEIEKIETDKEYFIRKLQGE